MSKGGVLIEQDCTKCQHRRAAVRDGLAVPLSRMKVAVRLNVGRNQSWCTAFAECGPDLPCDASAKAASLSGKHTAHMCCEQAGLDVAILTRS